MKEKIFAKLKQEYSALGLGDAVLLPLASALAATGQVADDNIDAVVASQRTDLESLQKVNDKRVSDALEKERKKHEELAKKLEEDFKKSTADAAKLKQRIEELENLGNSHNTATAVTPATPASVTPDNKTFADPRFDELKRQLDEILANGKAKDDAHAAAIAAGEKARLELEARLKELTDVNAASAAASEQARLALEARVKELTDKNAAAEAAAATAARKSMILAKAKELGVPQWRIDEGFNLADDATEELIVETLTKVANNISTNLLPGNRAVFPLNDGEPSKDDISALAASIVK